MSKLLNQWVDLFRAGNYGDKGTYTVADVQAIAASYKPEFHEAPIRIGHTDEDKAPAYGWLESLRCVGDTLQGKFKQVVPAFAEAVERGTFKKRSIGLKDYGHGLSVRHVAFLGAVPPEVKGLANIAFSAEDKNAIEIEFSEETGMTAEQIREMMSAWWEEKFGGKKTEPKTFSEEDAKRIAAEAVTAAVAPLEARLKTQETQFAERNTAIATTEQKQRAANAILKVKTAGGWVPAFDKMGLPLIFEELATTDVTIEFGEGDKKAQRTKLDIFTEFMEGLGRIVPTGNLAINGAAGTPKTTSGVNRGAFAVDENSDRLHQATVLFSEENNVGYIEAQTAVLRKNPDLARLGGASSGGA